MNNNNKKKLKQNWPQFRWCFFFLKNSQKKYCFKSERIPPATIIIFFTFLLLLLLLSSCGMSSCVFKVQQQQQQRISCVIHSNSNSTKKISRHFWTIKKKFECFHFEITPFTTTKKKLQHPVDNEFNCQKKKKNFLDQNNRSTTTTKKNEKIFGRNRFSNAKKNNDHLWLCEMRWIRCHYHHHHHPLRSPMIMFLTESMNEWRTTITKKEVDDGDDIKGIIIINGGNDQCVYPPNNK